MLNVQDSSKKIKKSRSPSFHWWLLTWNNPGEDWEQKLASLKPDYSIGQLEKGAEGTTHAQACLYFRSGRFASSFTGIPIWIRGIPAKDAPKTIAYCSKEDTRIMGPVETGTCPKLSKHSQGVDYSSALETCKEGKWDQCEASVLIRYLPNLQKLAHHFAPAYEPKALRGFWHYGKPGTGKSYFLNKTFPDAYRKSQNKWWDGYAGQKIVILDDFDKMGVCLGHYLKIWTDRYACSGEVKNGHVSLSHDEFHISSNYRIEDLFGECVLLVEALTRRFTVKFYPFVVTGKPWVISKERDPEDEEIRIRTPSETQKIMEIMMHKPVSE